MPDAIATQSQLRTRLKALRRARIQFRECLADPLRRAMLARSPLATAATVWELPAECAAAGFTLAMTQDKTGWHVTLTRAIDDETDLETAGDAKSLMKALFQIVVAVEQQIESMEAGTRHQLAQIEAVALTAA